MERNSIYVDSYFISSYVSHYYCRYVDDNSSLGPDRSYAQEVCDMISEQDPRGRIKWEIDSPRDNAFVPFPDTEVKITPEVSSGPEELQHSLNIVDELAVKNGYEPRKNYPSAKKKKIRVRSTELL